MHPAVTRLREAGRDRVEEDLEHDAAKALQHLRDGEQHIVEAYFAPDVAREAARQLREELRIQKQAEKARALKERAERAEARLRHQQQLRAERLERQERNRQAREKRKRDAARRREERLLREARQEIERAERADENARRRQGTRELVHLCLDTVLRRIGEASATNSEIYAELRASIEATGHIPLSQRTFTKLLAAMTAVGELRSYLGFRRGIGRVLVYAPTRNAHAAILAPDLQDVTE